MNEIGREIITRYEKLFFEKNNFYNRFTSNEEKIKIEKSRKRNLKNCDTKK